MTTAILILIIFPSIALIYATNSVGEHKEKSWIDRVELMEPEPMNRHTHGQTIYPTDLEKELSNARRKRYEKSLTDLRSQEEIEKSNLKRFRKFYSSKN